MAVTTAMADAILAEFLSRRGSEAVTKVKSRVRGMKLEYKRDLLEKAEFEPDNSRIGRQSRGLQSGFSLRVQWLLVAGCYDAAATAMVADYFDALRGDVPRGMVCTVIPN